METLSKLHETKSHVIRDKSLISAILPRLDTKNSDSLPSHPPKKLWYKNFGCYFAKPHRKTRRHYEGSLEQTWSAKNFPWRTGKWEIRGPSVVDMTCDQRRHTIFQIMGYLGSLICVNSVIFKRGFIGESRCDSGQKESVAVLGTKTRCTKMVVIEIGFSYGLSNSRGTVERCGGVVTILRYLCTVWFFASFTLSQEKILVDFLPPPDGKQVHHTRFILSPI